MALDKGRRWQRLSGLGWLAGRLFLLLLGAFPASAQDGSTDLPRFRASAQTVLVQVSVVDSEGAPVRGLERVDFSIYEDGVPQEITYFEQAANLAVGSIAIAILIDTSSSMRGPELASARNAALRFLKDAPALAEIAILAFDHELCLVHELTRDRPALASAVHRLEPGGGTALYEGVLDAIENLEGSRTKLQLLVVLSDGMDLDSGARFADVQRRLVTSPVVVHAVGLYSPPERKRFIGTGQFYKAPPLDVNLSPAWVLSEIARISGGAAYFPKSPVELEPLFSEIARGVHFQYVVGYTPATSDEEPRFREIRVRAARGPTDTFSVRARRGYVR